MSDRPWAVFLDFDGTLVDIAPSPDAVVVEPGLPEVLARLRDRLGGAVAIVTGRQIAEIERFLPDLPMDICGLHGLERRIDGHVSYPAGLAELAPEIDALRRSIGRRPGILIEDKRVGVAVHWRMAPVAEADAIAAVADLAGRLGPAYKIQEGKSVREIVPAGAGKGAAVRALMAAPPYRDRLPVFAGDDVTDENAFAAVNELGGLSVKVGPGPTAARHRADTAAAFRSWLAALSTGEAAPPDLPHA